MGKKRVYEIAKDEGLPSATLLQRLQREGMAVRTASSTVDEDWALHLLNPNRNPRPEGEMPVIEDTPRRARKKAPEPEPEAEETAPRPTRPRPTRPRPRRRTPEPTPEPTEEPTPTPAAEEPSAPVPTPEPTPQPVAESPAPKAVETPTPEKPTEPAEAPAAQAPDPVPAPEPEKTEPVVEAPEPPTAAETPAPEKPTEPEAPEPSGTPEAPTPDGASTAPTPQRRPAGPGGPGGPPRRPAGPGGPRPAGPGGARPAGAPRPGGPARPGGPRPAGPGGPRPAGPGGPGGPPRRPAGPGGPRPAGPGGARPAGAPRPGGPARPGGPRPAGPGGPRPAGPGGPGGPPRRPAGPGGPRPAGPGGARPAGAPRPGGPARPGGPRPAGPGGPRPGGPGGPGGRPGGPGGPGARPGGPGRPGGRPGGQGGRPGGPGGPGGPGRGGRRRVVIDAQAGRRPGGKGRGKGGQQQRDAETPQPEAETLAPKDMPLVEIPSGSSTSTVAELLGISAAQIIKQMMGMGEMVTLTQSLSDEAIELLAVELEREIKIVRAEDDLDEFEDFEDDPADLVVRAPVVTVMGHVDHGKTSLLDAIRKTEVAAGEAGGITQHIGAYQVSHSSRELTFLDTPGHEAFTAMRARGAKVTDVAVIVVAADDGVMPQTVEAIDHAKAAEVPFVVAVNKIDKSEANPDKVRQELSTREVIPTDWGGNTEFLNVSAHTGQGIEDLLETILLVADADADPKGNPKAPASGTVIESRLDAGRGPVCTVLVQRGTLNVGDVILAGEHFGRVRAMTDYHGRTVEAATPSVPVEILGLSGVPDAGDKFRIVENERMARQSASVRSQRLRAEELANRRAPVSLDDLFDRIKEGGLKELNIIVKGDVQGSVGALTDALEKIEQTEVRLRIILTGVGAITESDVNLAAASQAIIIGFNVRPRPEARILAEREGVDIRTYRIIYRAIEDVRDALVGLLEPDIIEETLGMAEVRATFRSSRLGTIAGCMVTEGLVRRSAKARLQRDGTIVHEGTIGSLRRVDDDVREVTQGFECGIILDGYNDVKEGDLIEVYDLKEVARTAQAAATPTPSSAEAAGDDGSS